MKIMLILLTFMLNREKISVRPIVKNANGHTVTVRKAPVHKNHFYVSLLFLITEWSQYGLYWLQMQIWRLRAWICFVVFFFARAAFKHKTKQIILPFFDQPDERFLFAAAKNSSKPLSEPGRWITCVFVLGDFIFSWW